jgi:uncharacterized protein
MRDIELTDNERFFLANQYEILAALKNDDHYAQIARSFMYGHKFLYQPILDQLSENLPQTDVNHVLAILNICEGIKDSYDKLSDNSGIEEHSIEFPGFCGKTEAQLCGFADNLIQHQLYQSTLGNGARNAHGPTTEVYKRMITRCKELGSPRAPYAKETLQQILAARIHPENRK